MMTSRVRLAAGFFALLLAAAPLWRSRAEEATHGAAPVSLREIFEPTVVGTPPENAFRGLVRLPDGQLRHYGFEGPQRNPTRWYYIFSQDHGLTWQPHADGLLTAAGARPRETLGGCTARSPYSGDFIRLLGTPHGTFVLLGRDGIDGPYEKSKIHHERFGMIRPPMFLRSRRRILVVCHQSKADRPDKRIQSCVIYSDDDGRTWDVARVPVGPRHEANWPHEKVRWQNFGCEATIAELAGGRLWMLLRTSMDELYESFSHDGGSTWSAPGASRFYATLTMPTFFRMKDGRLILFWCNTTPLAEVDRSGDLSLREGNKNGYWEDVFTNRDALHAAISEDDGATWRGFRELYLNPLRNDAEFATRGDVQTSLDRSVHQSQAVELPHGKVLVALGQHSLVRVLLIFDPDWLYQTRRSSDFSNALHDWSTFKYLRGIRGHCAYNRDPGAPLVDHPHHPGRKVLHLRRVADPQLICENDGAVWNFPAGMKGTFATRLMLQPAGQGCRICLVDRWFNPTDPLVEHFALYRLTISGDGRIDEHTALQPGRWHELRLAWDHPGWGPCRLYVDGQLQPGLLPLNVPSRNGVSYVHFQSIAADEDRPGVLIESVRASTRGGPLTGGDDSVD